MYHPDSVVKLHQKILKDAGLEHIRFHDLRHTFATIALQNGIDVKTVSSMLGHASAGFTLATYTHATSKVLRTGRSEDGEFDETGAVTEDVGTQNSKRSASIRCAPSSDDAVGKLGFISVNIFQKLYDYLSKPP